MISGEILPTESICYSDLSSADKDVRASIQSSIETAYGTEGPGLLLVHGLPSEFPIHRERLLEAGNNLGVLPRSELEKLEFPDVNYMIGWSHGKEMFNGVPDTSKGGFYANPIYDDPSLGDPQLPKDYPFNMRPNVWPTSKSVENLEPGFKYIGKLANEIALEIAKHIDIVVQNKMKETNKNVNKDEIISLHETLSTSRSAKGRLLHFFPISVENCNKEGSLWFGYHNDIGAITGLVSAKLFHKEDQTVKKRGPNKCGLYVLPAGEKNPKKVVIPPDCLAFQIGEAAQILTGGILRATPHGVVAPSFPDVTRAGYAVFLQPNPWVKLKIPSQTKEDALYSSDIVPALKERFSDGDTFHQLCKTTSIKFSSQGS